MREGLDRAFVDSWWFVWELAGLGQPHSQVWPSPTWGISGDGAMGLSLCSRLVQDHGYGSSRVPRESKALKAHGGLGLKPAHCILTYFFLPTQVTKPA